MTQPVGPNLATDDFDPDNPPPIGTLERAVWLVHWHFAWENTQQLDKLADLYHEDIVWELPGSGVLFQGKKSILENYRKVFESSEGLHGERVDQYATPTRVFDDMIVNFKLISAEGFPYHPVPIGSQVRLRLVHSFHIQDGLIIRENGYEMWPITAS